MLCLVTQPNSVVLEVQLDSKSNGQECLEKVGDNIAVSDSSAGCRWRVTVTLSQHGGGVGCQCQKSSKQLQLVLMLMFSVGSSSSDTSAFYCRIIAHWRSGQEELVRS